MTVIIAMVLLLVATYVFRDTSCSSNGVEGPEPAREPAPIGAAPRAARRSSPSRSTPASPRPRTGEALSV